MARKWFLGLVLFSSVCSAPVLAGASPIKIFNFQLGGIAAFSAGTDSVFGQASWTPSVSFGVFGIRGEIGITSFQFGAGSRFLATNYEVLAQIYFPGFNLEGGGGVHIWHGQNPAAAAFSGNLVFTSTPGVDRLYIGYSRYTGGIGADEIRAGFGFDLF